MKLACDHEKLPGNLPGVSGATGREQAAGWRRALVHNLLALRRIGFAANRRRLEVEQISHDCALGEDAFQHLQRQRKIDDQHAAALRFGDANAQALLNAVLMLVFVARGIANKDLRQVVTVGNGMEATRRRRQCVSTITQGAPGLGRPPEDSRAAQILARRS